MRYRIEVSANRRAARVHLPGRGFELEAARASATEWEVSLTPVGGGNTGIITVAAASAGDAVWRVARAAVRAFAELTGQQLEDEPPAASP
jgi:hypothetical protein